MSLSLKDDVMKAVHRNMSVTNNKAVWIEAKSGFNINSTNNYKCSNCGNKEKFATLYCSFCGREMHSDKEIFWKRYM